MPHAALCRRNTTPMSARKAPPASRPAPLPATFAPEVTSALASAISPRTMPSRSWVASATSWPMVRSVPVVPVVMRLRLTRALSAHGGPSTDDLTQTPSPSVSRGLALEDVRDTIGVLVEGLELREALVSPVAHAQHDGREGLGQERAEEDRQLDVVVALGTAAERELTDEQGHGEPHAGEQCEPQHVGPRQTAVELGPGEPGEHPGGAEDADDLADDEPEEHTGDGRVHAGTVDEGPGRERQREE